MNNILEVQKVTTGYNGIEVLRDISFQVKRGEILGIIGPNGAGKTTLFKIIARSLLPWRGSIYYNDNNILRISVKNLFQEITILPQIIETPFSFNVFDFVSMGRYPHLKRMEELKKLDFEIIEHSMSLTDILRLKDRPINHLSGGERQRVFLAQALTQTPKLLLLDEPITHLDIGHQVGILDIIKRLNKEHTLTVIMILHDLNLAAEYCDRLILMDRGGIYKMGIPDEVLTYQNIEDVYKTIVVVKENPMSGKPYVVLISQSNYGRKGGENSR